MPEEKTTAGGKPAAAAVSTGLDGHVHPHTNTIDPQIQEPAQPAPSSNGAGAGDMLAEINDLLKQAKVEPADVLTASKVAALLPQLAAYQGAARQAALDALRVLIGALPTTERELLAAEMSASQLFERQADLEKYLASCPEPPGAPIFKPKSLADLLAMPPKQWLVDQVIGAGDLAMIYGPPGSGKTFAVIDLTFAACLGRQWAMRFAVARPLTVAYACSEGASGLPARFAAAAEFYGADDLPGFEFYDTAPQLFDGGLPESIGRFVAERLDRQAAGDVGLLDLLIIDTLHGATVGADENSAQDMGRVLAAAKAAVRALGCAVLLVHHSRKDGQGERGSSALRGALDTLISVSPSASKFALAAEKLKDGEKWKAQTFDLVAMGESVRVWWDEPAELEGSSSRHAAALLAELQKRPGVRFTAKQLAEVVGATPQATGNVLARLVSKGDVQRCLMDESKPPSSRNPWVYYAVEKTP